MEIHKGNIWSLRKDHAIVIPTNMGWKKDGTNVMGRGLAKQAAERYRGLPKLLGKEYGIAGAFGLMKANNDPPVVRTQEPDGVELIFVPSKKLVIPAYLSWKEKADLALIRKSLEKLKRIHLGRTRKPKIAIPLIGTGNGQLPKSLVDDLIHELFVKEEKVTLVYRLVVRR